MSYTDTVKTDWIDDIISEDDKELDWYEDASAEYDGSGIE